MGTNHRPINVDINLLQQVKCPDCTGITFSPALELRILPAFMTGNPMDMFVALEYGYICTTCSRVIGSKDLLILNKEAANEHKTLL